ncbi:MAG: ADP-ribosylation factor family protein [Promethearchaeota archaeon]
MSRRKRRSGKQTNMHSARIVMCGLDAAGKTTIINYIRQRTITHPIPTSGVNFETIRYKNFELNVSDLGGQISFRLFWQDFLNDADVICYVIDISDHERLAESAQEFKKIIEVSSRPDCPILIIANKCDKENLLETSQIIKEFGLNQPFFLKRALTWQLQVTSTKTGKGIIETFDWLYEQMTGEKLPETLSIRDIALFSHLGVSLAQTKGSTFKDPVMTAGFFAALEQFAQSTNSHQLDSLIIGEYKIVFERVKELLGALVMNVEDSEITAKEILNNIIGKIFEKGEANAQEILMEFIKSQLESYMTTSIKVEC